MTENFKFNLIEEFSGYNSCRDKTTIDPSFLIRGSLNTYFKRSGTVATRPGLKRRGAIDATQAGIKSSFEWESNVGITYPLRVVNNKLQVEINLVWYDLYEHTTLLNPARSLTRFVFDIWWSDNAQKDILIMCRGDDTLLSWNGGVALVDSSAVVTNSISAITVSAGGSGYVVGDIVTILGGITPATFLITGVTAGAVTGFSFINPGAGYVTGSSINSTTNGAGTGATFNITSVASATNIVKQGTDTFEAIGFSNNNALSSIVDRYVVIGGVEYLYSTDGTNLFIFATPTINQGDVIITSVFVHDNEPINGYKCDFIKILNNQLLVGSYSSRLVYLSADIDFTDFSNGGSYVPGDPDQIILDTVAKGIGIKDDKAIIFGGNADLYVVTLNTPVPISYSVPGEAGPRFIITKVEKQVLAANSAALAHEFIGNFADDLIWLDQDNQLRTLGSFSQIFTIKPTLLSLPVQEELSEDDFTDGHLRIIGDTVYISEPISGRDWMYQVRQILNDRGEITSQRMWHPPQVRNISRFALINGVIYGHSNTNPQIYQMWDTGQWFDDSPDEQELPYLCRMKMAYRSHKERFILKTFDKLAFEGYMEEGVNLNCYVYFEYQGSAGIENLNVNSVDSPTKFYSGISPFSLGDSSLGDNPLGVGVTPEGDEQDSLAKFRTIADVNPINCFEYSIELYTSDVDSRWEILTLGDNARAASELPAYLRK